MMIRLATALTAALTAALILPAPAMAQTTDDLFDALALPEMIGIMRQEGLAYGEQIGTDLFPGRGGAEWMAMVDAIYDAERMEAAARAALTEELAGRDIAPMLTFFTTDPGPAIVALEVSARSALLDDAVEEVAKETAAIAIADQTPRYQIVNRFVAANDLIETNVVGAMNSNYAFYIGLMQGGAFPAELSEDQILADVWSREDEIRQNTTEWVYTFLMMAYQPVPEADLEAYVAFSESPPGQVLNRAIFAAFDEMFVDISAALGQASARFVVGQDL